MPRLLALAAFLFAAFVARPALACTGILLRPDDRSAIYARTLEFGADVLSFDLISVPRGQEYRGLTPAGANGATWRVKYGHVGFCPFGMPLLGDGLNERGLACGAFYLPGYAEYQQVDEGELSLTISGLDFVSWTLGNFATVAEVRDALKSIRVVDAKLPAWGFVPPLHYRLADASGDSIVVEYTGGELHVFETPLGVVTNSPTYDWHETNARNYIGLAAINRPGLKIGGADFAGLGQGTGAVGLPGDFTPPARFIRAAFFVQTVHHGRTASEGVDAAFHILDQFDIPRGSVRETDGDKTIDEVTQWTSAADLTNRRYYFHTEGNRRVRVIELDKLDLTAGQPRIVKAGQSPDYEDVSGQFDSADAKILSGPTPGK